MKAVKTLYRGVGMAMFLTYASTALPFAVDVYQEARNAAVMIYSDVESYMHHSLQSARRYR